MCWKGTFSEKLILQNKQSIEEKTSDITVSEVNVWLYIFLLHAIT